MTNGCFDLLHCGHVEYLAAANKKAHETGMPLLVAINSDDSVRRLKGAGRPINTLVDRAKMLCMLRCVSAVMSFNEDTPLEIVKIVKPRLLIKAEDYKDKLVVGADFVKANGGEVWLAPYRQDMSTTNLVNKSTAQVVLDAFGREALVATVRKGQKVVGPYGAIGTTTGGRRPCKLEGCTGGQIAVRWEDRKLTYCCTAGMTFKNDIWKIDSRFHS